LKVALVILHADPSRGGAERYTIDLARALARRGHAVSLLASSFNGAVEQVQKVTIAARGITRAGKYRAFLYALDAHLATERYDIVHAMLPVRRCDLYHPHAGIAAEALGRLNVHFNPRRKRMAEVERELLLRSNGPVVLCLSNYIKQFVLKHYPLSTERLETLFNAVDLEQFVPQAQSARETVEMLFIGHDFERKGLGPTIAAMRTLDDERLRLTVVGRPSRSFHLPPMKDVRRIDSTNDPVPLYAQSDVFVLPTKHDPCSLVVLEALAMGLPVISTKFNGACEIMTDGVHGFVLEDPQDAEALAGAMRKMLDAELRGRMRAACLELRPKLSYEHHLDQLEAIYEKIIRSPLR
jgi:UDP-glucose:(heptosyl)LPS alpha-1,3-glucosyltransferase